MPSPLTSVSIETATRDRKGVKPMFQLPPLTTTWLVSSQPPATASAKPTRNSPMPPGVPPAPLIATVVLPQEVALFYGLLRSRSNPGATHCDLGRACLAPRRPHPADTPAA